MPTETPHGSELKERFFDALDLTLGERQSYLSKLATEDAAMHRLLVELLEAHERAEDASAAAQRAVDDDDEAAAGLNLPISMGNYELLEQIAEGGSGVVYRARQVDLDRTVAIKLLRSGLLATGEEVQRFRFEAEICARLDHPSIVPVHEVGNHEGRHFICMKLIEGSSLDQRVADYQSDPRSAAELVARITRAVHHGHRHGVLHRDVKPSNVLLDRDGTPFVADFGTAKLIDGAQDRTVPGWILGTPTYMAPEQASASGDVTVATDVYSLGCVLYELLVGRPPLVAKGLVETLRAVQEDLPTPLCSLRPELHRDLETICQTCLAKEPERRYSSALALAEDLERWLAFEPIYARKTTPVERILLAWRRNPLVSSLIAAVAVLAVALVVGALLASIELAAQIEDTREAEGFANEQLRNAYLAEARALRHGGQVGRRERALELAGLAAGIRPGRDLRDEGISSLALSDIATARSWPLSDESPSMLCFDAQFERYFVGHKNGELEVRSALDGTQITALTGNGYPVWRARFGQGGRYLGVVHHGVGKGNRTVIWDLNGPVRLMDVPARPSGHFDLAPDRPAVTLCWSDGRLHEIDLETLEERTLAQFDPENLPKLIRYSPTGKSVAVALSEEAPIGIYSMTGEVLAELNGHDGLPLTLTWSPDGSRLLAGCSEQDAYVWDMESTEPIATLKGHGAEVVRSAFPRHDVAATYSWDGTTRLWDLQTSETLAITKETLVESPPARDLVGLSTPAQIRLGSIVHGTVLRELHGHGSKDPSSLSIDPTDSLIASGGEDDILLWDLASGERLDGLELESLKGLHFLPDGSLLAGTKERLVRLSIEHGRFVGPAEVLREEPARSLTLDPDGQCAAYLSSGDLVLLSLGRDGEALRIPTPAGTSFLAFSADGRLIAAGCYRGSGVRIWSTSDGAEIAHLSAEESDCLPQFSPDGLWLVYGTHREYRVHRVGSWDLEYRVSRGDWSDYVAKLTRYSPDGTVLAGTFGRHDIMLLDPLNGETLAVFEAPGDQQFSQGRFTSDGRHLVVASESNRVLVWDLVRLRQELGNAGLDAGIGPGWTRALTNDEPKEQ